MRHHFPHFEQQPTRYVRVQVNNANVDPISKTSLLFSKLIDNFERLTTVKPDLSKNSPIQEPLGEQIANLDFAHK